MPPYLVKKIVIWQEFDIPANVIYCHPNAMQVAFVTHASFILKCVTGCFEVSISASRYV